MLINAAFICFYIYVMYFVPIYIFIFSCLLKNYLLELFVYIKLLTYMISTVCHKYNICNMFDSPLIFTSQCFFIKAIRGRSRSQTELNINVE